MDLPLSDHEARVVDGKIYVIGGTNLLWPGKTIPDVLEYTPEGGIFVSPQGRLWKVWGGVK
jgi:hypothetical protein